MTEGQGMPPAPPMQPTGGVQRPLTARETVAMPTPVPDGVNPCVPLIEETGKPPMRERADTSAWAVRQRCNMLEQTVQEQQNQIDWLMHYVNMISVRLNSLIVDELGHG